ARRPRSNDALATRGSAGPPGERTGDALMRRRPLARLVAVLAACALAAAIVLRVVSSAPGPPAPTFSQIMSDVGAGRVASASMDLNNQELSVVYTDGRNVTTGYPDNFGRQLTNALTDHHVQLDVAGRGGSAWW